MTYFVVTIGTKKMTNFFENSAKHLFRLQFFDFAPFFFGIHKIHCNADSNNFFLDLIPNGIIDIFKVENSATFEL